MNMVVIAKGDTAMDHICSKLKLKKTLNKIKTVMIKPNLRAAGTTDYMRCAITNPDVIKSLALWLVDLGIDVSIGECTPSSYITERALQNSGIKSLENKGINILNLNRAPCKKVRINGIALKNVEVPKPVLDTEFLISLPVMKTHSLTLVTLSMKNMIGATAPLQPHRIHYVGLQQAIADINRILKPDLSIIDATRAMEGSGPVKGREVKLNTLIGGYDPVAVDSIAARVMGFDPYAIPHIAMAEKTGIGNIEPIEVEGELEVKEFVKPGEDGVTNFIGNHVLSSRFFNLLMSNRFLHLITFDYFFDIYKRITWVKNK
jgi:uncharacterized protein (DUF362 family)